MFRTRTLLITSAVAVATTLGSAATVGAQETAPTTLEDAITAALDAVGTDNVVQSVELNRNGTFDIDLRAPDGTETDLILAADLSVVSERTDVDDDRDDRADLVFDEAARASAAEAALAAVDDGEVVAMSTDDDGYDVEILHPDNSTTDVELTADFTVIDLDTDPADDPLCDDDDDRDDD